MTDSPVPSSPAMTVQMYVAFFSNLFHGLGTYIGALKFSFKQKQLAALATPHMEIVAGMSQGLAALADILIVAGLTFSLQTSKNPRMRQCVPW